MHKKAVFLWESMTFVLWISIKALNVKKDALLFFEAEFFQHILTD